MSEKKGISKERAREYIRVYREKPPYEHSDYIFWGDVATLCVNPSADPYALTKTGDLEYYEKVKKVSDEILKIDETPVDSLEVFKIKNQIQNLTIEMRRLKERIEYIEHSI